MAGNNKKVPQGLSNAPFNRRRNGNSLENGDHMSPVTMAQVNSLVAKNEKAMQVLIENYRRSGSNTPLWLSSTPYYKKDSMLVVNMRDERFPLHFVNEPPVETEKAFKPKKEADGESKARTPTTPVGPYQPTKTDRQQQGPGTQQGGQKSFAVSGGDAAQRLGLRIGAAADLPLAKGLQPTASKADYETKVSPPAKQHEITIVGNVKNLGMGWDSGSLDTILLGGAAPSDPLTINSDPLWGAESASAHTSEHELQNMLSMLRDLGPASFDSPVSSGQPLSQVTSSKLAGDIPTPSAYSQASSMPQPVTSTASAAAPSTLTVNSQPQQVPSQAQQMAGFQQVSQQQAGQQYYYFMTPQGVPMMAPMPSVQPNQLQYIQQFQQQAQQLLSLNQSQQYYAQNQAQAQAQAQQRALQQQQQQQQQQQAYYGQGVNGALSKQQQQQQHAAVSHQQLIAAQLAAQQLQQQQQLASQQQAALAAQQLLSKPASAPSTAASPAVGGPTVLPASNVPVKSPNPNARPFQPPGGEKRFNVEAAPFVPGR